MRSQALVGFNHAVSGSSLGLWPHDALTVGSRSTGEETARSNPQPCSAAPVPHLPSSPARRGTWLPPQQLWPLPCCRTVSCCINLLQKSLGSGGCRGGEAGSHVLSCMRVSFHSTAPIALGVRATRISRNSLRKISVLFLRERFSRRLVGIV